MSALTVLPVVPVSRSPRRPVPQLADPTRQRSLRIAFLITAVAILNALDLVYTLFAQNINMLDETNPFAEVFLRADLLPSFICFKILMVTCGLGVIWKLRANRLAVPACWFLLMAYAWLGIVWVQWVHVTTRILETRLAGTPP
jgi:hypothetical protein